MFLLGTIAMSMKFGVFNVNNIIRMAYWTSNDNLTG